MARPEPLAVVRAYHDRTKHHPARYARSLGYMDWATQPDPFRTYAGAERLPLDHPPLRAAPTYDALFTGAVAPLPVGREAISRLFYDSLALSAWKQAPGTRPWSLRVNPSSGALHPTEGYLLAGPVPGLSDAPGVYHYAPYWHALERRLTFEPARWQRLTADLPQPCVLVGLTSIYWREAWKYGERAFRYCHHDVGHAIGTVTFAARTLGWRARLLDGVAPDDLARLLGVHDQQGPEAEHPDGLLVLYPEGAAAPPGPPRLRVGETWSSAFQGQANRLSHEHHDWPVIDEVSLATRQAAAAEYSVPSTQSEGGVRGGAELTEYSVLSTQPAAPADRGLPAQQIIRQRRSAVDMDGRTTLPAPAFYALLDRLLPGRYAVPFAVLPWEPCTSLLLFVHRVDGVEPGMYVLVRHPGHEASLRAHLRPDAVWGKPAGCPEGLPLYLLVAGEARRAAKLASCQQDIAADGAFAVAMLCEFEPRLRRAGASFYPKLFWETGLIGQVLYLEAEAAGLRGTGIGCFFDDTTHHYAGLSEQTWQDLYHFTLGGAVEDPRLKTIPPYAHLEGAATS